MRKQRITFSIFNYFEPVSAEVVKIQAVVKGVFTMVAGASFITMSEHYTLFVMLFGYILNEAMCCLKIELKKLPNQSINEKAS
jgi:hypothetical protein